MSVTVKYAEKDITFQPIANWREYVESTNDGEASWSNLSEATTKGIPGTLGLIFALGHTDAKISSGWRSPEANSACTTASKSQHLIGNAIDIVCGDDSFMQEFCRNIACCDFDGNAGYGSYWHMGEAHEGTGYHIHLDNYLGGLGDEPDEEKQKLKAADNRDGGPPQPGNGKYSAAGNNSASKDFVVKGQKVFVRPQGKTFAEPTYPDLMYVTGNIPNSLIEKTASDNDKKIYTVQDANSPYKILTGTTMQDLTGLAMGGFTTDQAQQDRQKTYNASSSVNEFKTPSAGKPLNNRDRYPTDLKCEELELHQPKVKQDEIIFRQIDNDKIVLAKSILMGLDHAEKRIAKLENVLATVLRYTIGIGSRVQINCVYYGGQDHRSKYQCIRCMRDDRVQDGQVMQIDQCLSCSRYEPIIGQTYEIQNELGANLAAILDDNQMGYQNMRDYLKLTRVDQYPSPMAQAKLDPATVKTREQTEKDFCDEWDQGVKMKWKLTPVENQKPLINWRTDINHPDGTPKKLASYQFNPANAGQTGGTSSAGYCSIRPGKVNSMMQSLYNAMKSSSDAEVQRWYQDGEDYATGSGGAVDGTLNNMNDQGWAPILQKVAGEEEVDPLLMLAIFATETGGRLNASGGGIGQVQANKGKTLTAEEDIRAAVQAWKSKASSKDGDNPLPACQGYISINPALEALRSPTATYDHNWVTAIASTDSDKQYFVEFPRICCCYIKFAQLPAGLSLMATESTASTYEFPFADAKLKEVFFIEDYGAANEGKGAASVSQAATFKIPEGSEVHMSMNGVVADHGEDDPVKGTWIDINYGNGEHMIYTHLDSFSDLCKARMGSAGGGGERDGMLKQEVFGVTGAKGTMSVIFVSNGTIDDPKKKWPALAGKVSTVDSLGAQLTKGKANASNAKAKDNVVIGGDADGTYNMDDDNNYIWKTDDKKSTASDTKAPTDKDTGKKDGAADDSKSLTK